MRYIAVLVLGVLFSGASARASEVVKDADRSVQSSLSLSGADTRMGERGLSAAAVEKLNAEQLLEVLENREIYGEDEGRALSQNIVEKLSAEQLAEVLNAKDAADKARSPLPKLLVPILVPLFFFVCISFLVGLPLYLRFREHTQRHETLQLMVEKGVEIPAELIAPQQRQKSDLRRGLILLSAGLGLTLCLGMMNSEPSGVWSMGLIPVFLGLGHLAAWRLENQPISRS